MLGVIPENNPIKLKGQIDALKGLIRNDKNSKDKEIHTKALKVLETKLEQLERGCN